MTGFKPWHLVPLMVAAALAGAGYWWMQEKERWVPPVALKPDLPKLEALPTPTTVQAKQAEARPMLWSSRRPPEQVEKKSNIANELMEARLSAVFESGKIRIAVLQRPDGAPWKITSDTSPWRLESFDGRKAVFLSKDGQQVERPLEAGGAAPASGRGGVPVSPRAAAPRPSAPAANPIPSPESFRLH